MAADLERLAAVVRHTSNLVVITDQDRKIQWVNDAFTRFYGYTLAEAREHTPLQLLGSGVTDPEAYAAMDRAAEAEVSCRVEVVNRSKDGSHHDIELEVQPYRDPEGRLMGFMQLGVDVTEKKRAAAQLQAALKELSRERVRLKDVLEGTHVGTWEWDIPSCLLTCDERWAYMIGYSAQDVSPLTIRRWRRHVHRADLRHAIAVLKAHFARRTEYYECELRLRHRNGDWIWVLLRGRVSAWTAAGRPTSMAGTQMDITTRKRAEEQLRSNKAFLKRAERVSGVGGWEVDLRTGVLTWSDQTFRIYELAPGAPQQSRALHHYFAVPEQDLINRTARECIDQRKPWDLELPMTTATGRSIWVRSVGTVEMEDDHVVRLVGTLQDVTAARALREELRRNHTTLQSIVDNLPCGLSVFDGNLDLIAFNEQFRLLLDLPQALFARGAIQFEDVVRVNAARGEYGPGSVDDIVGELVERARHPKRLLFERERHDGKPLEVRSAPMPGGGFVTTYMDISERKKIERMQHEFISTVSHELRTPLTAIYGSLRLLDSQTVGPLAPDVQELVSVALSSCERLVRLISDVLDVERIQAGLMRYAFSRQALVPLIDEAIRSMQAYAEPLRVSLLFESRVNDAYVDADPDRITQVLVNLISNAVKFSAPDHPVTVGMSVVDGYVRVCVTDRGVGIPAEFRPRIFERFAQADGSDRRLRGGTGLGLNICRSIVEAHRGRIDFVSTVGVGTEFFFELPRMPAP
ncbi:PAS-domain containing protein [Variovorax paradoxus]|nr:PAS-domain containing protein [Variovorax paradoxus]